MKVDQATFAAHGAALLDAAGRLFRERGLGVSVTEVSRAAGLTHGAFYGHYDTKDALAAASCRHSLTEGAAKWRARADATPHDRLGGIIDGYLTQAHRDDPAQGGCALPALGAEAVRQGGALAKALNEGAQGLLAVLTEEIAMADPTLDAAAIERASLGVLAVLTGGVILARALKPDATRSAAALAASASAARTVVSSMPRSG